MCENYQNIYENAALQASDSKVSAISRSLWTDLFETV